MSGRLTRDAYAKLVDENRAWLARQPRTLERDHIDLILKTNAELEYDLRAKLAAAEETIRKLHSIAWPRGGDLNGDPECDLLLMVGTFKCTISEMESKLAASEKERDLPKGERDRAQATALAALADADRFRAELAAALGDFSAVVAELECEPTRADAVAAIGLLESARDAALAQVATLTAERDEWQCLSGMDCDGMNCPPSEELKVKLAAFDAALERIARCLITPNPGITDTIWMNTDPKSLGSTLYEFCCGVLGREVKP